MLAPCRRFHAHRLHQGFQLWDKVNSVEASVRDLHKRINSMERYLKESMGQEEAEGMVDNHVRRPLSHRSVSEISDGNLKLAVAQPSMEDVPGTSQRAAPVEGPAQLTIDDFHLHAARALRSSPEFKLFTLQYPGTFFMLRTGGISAERVPDAEALSADVWAFMYGHQRLIYPAWGLRRVQSGLVADKGRLAEERLGSLFEIVFGEELAAIRPATVEADRWIILNRGVLAVPY